MDTSLAEMEGHTRTRKQARPIFDSGRDGRCRGFQTYLQPISSAEDVGRPVPSYAALAAPGLLCSLLCTAPSHQSASSHLSVHPFPCPAHLAAQWDCVDSPSLESSSYQTHVEGLISRWAFASAWRV
ncbi:hypothetical protein EYF80_005121 [Liparis tanakae]|uniref:Uncharacterized protein n=1 Tax=Liparis tanakae TaxID=230148 RepID=A0A4Z2J3D5_9TELE|nr:hypothetical protein EYF80_005121 [Liparis tanakae]